MWVCNYRGEFTKYSCNHQFLETHFMETVEIMHNIVRFLFRISKLECEMWYLGCFYCPVFFNDMTVPSSHTYLATYTPLQGGSDRRHPFME